MKCTLLLALAFRAQFGQGFTGPAGGMVLSNCISTAARSSNGIVRRGVASSSVKTAASGTESDASSIIVRKPAIINAIAEESELNKTQAEAALAAFMNIVMKEVAEGKKINLAGFGTFEGRLRKGRTGRNPRTGEAVEIKASTSPAFSPSKAFKEMVKAAHTD